MSGGDHPYLPCMNCVTENSEEWQENLTANKILTAWVNLVDESEAKMRLEKLVMAQNSGLQLLNGLHDMEKQRWQQGSEGIK